MIVKQIRYYGEVDDPRHDLNTKNFDPKNLLNEGSIYCDEIRIKTHPETWMTINGASVLVGKNGRYEIPFKEKTKITSASIDDIRLIRENWDASFVMTFILNQDESITANSDYAYWLLHNGAKYSGNDFYDNHDDGSEGIVTSTNVAGTAICGQAPCGDHSRVDYAWIDRNLIAPSEEEIASLEN